MQKEDGWELSTISPGVSHGFSSVQQRADRSSPSYINTPLYFSYLISSQEKK